MTSWWNKSGGIGYHYLAWRFRSSMWYDYLATISRFLDTFYQDSSEQPNHLLLIGPSGGYTLPTLWLRRFQHIQAIDPDPFAPSLFARSHGSLNISWDNKNYFLDNQGRWHLDQLFQLKEQYPHHLWFFANLIGQLPFLIKSPCLEDEPQWRKWQADWHFLLYDLQWISIHDIFSVNFPIDLQFKFDSACALPPRKKELIEILQNYFYQKATAKRLRKLLANRNPLASTPTIIDHLTYQLLPKGTHHRMTTWSLCPGQSQIIEIVGRMVEVEKELAQSLEESH